MNNKILNKRLIHKVSRQWGLQPSYLNIDKEWVWSDPEVLLQVLSSLSEFEINTDKDLIELGELRRKNLYERGSEPCLVVWQGQKTFLQLYLSEKEINQKGLLRIRTEQGQESYKKELDFSKIPFHRIYLPENLPLGYLNLDIEIGTKTIQCVLISAPSSLHSQVNSQMTSQKSWGAFVPMYALKSDSDWGIGSLAEFNEIAKWSANSGAEWLGTLPLLAANYSEKGNSVSPYSASTRLFWNEIFLDVDKLLLKYQNKKAQQIMQSSDFQNQLNLVHKTDLVDYHEVYKLKKEVLKQLAEDFFKTGKENLKNFLDWKKINPDIDDYTKFRSTKINKIEEQHFHLFVQYEMSLQLQEFNQGPCGLYLDYPVGVLENGYDFFKYKKSFFKDVSIGAPPEKVFQLGQNWCMPALHPHKIREDAYLYFRRTLQNHMRHCKILRLDHIMGLHRIYCIPQGRSGKEGLYLRYKPEELFAIVTLEAHQHKVDVIGENLGTVPHAVQEQIDKRNWNGMQVFQFEVNNPIKDFKIPNNVIISMNSHDTPTLSGFLKMKDLNLVCELGIISEENRNSFRWQRMSGLQKWFNYFGIPFDANDSQHHFFNSLTHFLAQSSAKYFVLNLEDLWQEEEFQNVPGTHLEVPNWRRKFKPLIKDIVKNDSHLKVLEILKRNRSKTT